jgi:hypothetical protein
MKLRRADLRRLLESAGSMPTPPPDPGFVDGLEARLFATSEPSRRSASHQHRAFFAAAAAIVLVALLGIGMAAGWFADDARALQLRVAADTTVVLPNGRTVAGRAGLSLEDGTLVRVGPRGHAAIGRVEIGPSEEAVVVNGRVHVRTDQTVHTRPVPPTDSAPATTDAAPTSTVAPYQTRAPSTTRAPTPTTRRTDSPTTTSSRADPGTRPSR